ncbi:hypothetical protein ACFVS2_25970 [Brevibacillus sp. NPDC058079]|uniref:hypothetical protein n=1 Tax=Brevibacillus sp. NPDC058079 TaxID=3346330 RepID=UPI0036F18017
MFRFRVNKTVIINGKEVAFDFVPGDHVRVKYGRCQEHRNIVGVIKKIEGVVATIRWQGNVVRGSEWTVDALEYVKKMCLFCDGTGGDGVDIEDYCPCPQCGGIGYENCNSQFGVSA